MVNDIDVLASILFNVSLIARVMRSWRCLRCEKHECKKISEKQLRAALRKVAKEAQMESRRRKGRRAVRLKEKARCGCRRNEPKS